MPSDTVYGTLFNADVVALSNGMVLRISGNNSAVRALADSAPHVQGLAGVNASGIVGVGGPANVVSAAVKERVLCETGLTPVAGQTLYVSAAVAGRATNVAPALAVAIGTIEDVGSYTQDSRVFATVAIPNATAAGGVFPGFGAAPPAIGPTTAGTSGLAAQSDHTHPWRHVANQAALDALDASTMLDGQMVYVDTYKDTFELTASTQSVAADVRRTALNKAGYLWIRRGFSPGWWSQLSWFITSSALANNEASGAASNAPISPQEYRRRHFARWLPGTETASVTLTLVADLGDNDYIQAYWSQGLRGGVVSLSVVGSQTVVATGAISAATALDRATNQPNEITAGFSWATHVGRMIRLQGTTTTTAHVMKDLGGNAARLGEQNVAGATGTGFTAAQTIEVVTCTKVPGLHVIGPIQTIVTDVDFDPAATTSLKADAVYSALAFTRCKFRSSGTSTVFGASISTSACAFVDRSWNLNAGKCTVTLCTQVNQAGQGLVVVGPPCVENQFQSHMSQASTLLFGEHTFMHVSGGGSATIGFFDLAAAQSGLTASVHGHIDCAAMWGSGNNASSVPIFIAQTGASYGHAAGVSSFTVAGGVGLSLLCGGVAFSVPLVQLPHAIGSGQQPGSSLKFTGALVTDAGGATLAYLSDPGTLLAVANQTLPQRYPTSERLALRLRVTKRVGAVLTNAATATVYKNGVATSMTVSIPAADAINTKYVDSSHPTLFADGDDIDVRLDDAADVLAGTLLVSSQVEFAN